MAPQQQQMDPAQANAAARAAVIAMSVERIQQIFSQTFAGTQVNGPINVNPRNVGLIKGFFVDVSVTVTNPGPGNLQLTQFGPANVLSQVRFDDLQNNTRIQTTGWHLHLINTVRNQRPWGIASDAYLSSGSGIQYTSDYPVIVGGNVVAANSGTITMRYYVPLAYSNSDLRGAIYANVVNATMQLGLTINPQMAVIGTAAQALQAANTAVWTNSTADAVAPTIDSVSVTVYQHYLDQLPMSNAGPVLPMLDLQTIYELKNTTMTGMSVDQDFTVPYANFRTFLSTIAIFDNANTGTGDGYGADVNYWALRSANFTDILKISPYESALLSRLTIGTDLPGWGTYYFSHRNKPINTIQYGNMELVLNASAINANSPNRIFVGYEDFAMINVVSGAGSLPAGG